MADTNKTEVAGTKSRPPRAGRRRPDNRRHRPPVQSLRKIVIRIAKKRTGGYAMEINVPSDCGNAPRIGIVGDFAVSWAAGDRTAVGSWLTDDADWTLVGEGTFSGPEAAANTGPPFNPERVELISIITHGRLASCDGYLEAAGKRFAFSHAFRFASTSKTAKIAELRSYCIAL